jgi:hypothetical protein
MKLTMLTSAQLNRELFPAGTVLEISDEAQAASLIKRGLAVAERAPEKKAK